MKYYLVQGVKKYSNTEGAYRIASCKEDAIKEYFEKTISVSLLEKKDYYGFFTAYPELSEG